MRAEDLRPRSPFLSQLPDAAIRFLDSVAHDEEYRRGDVIFEEDGAADTFYVIESGRVGLEITNPGRPPMVIQTLADGDLVGVSWMFRPHRWSWRARALAETRMLSFDAVLVRRQIEGDSELEQGLLAVIAREAVRRLHATRLQLLDFYRGA